MTGELLSPASSDSSVASVLSVAESTISEDFGKIAIDCDTDSDADGSRARSDDRDGTPGAKVEDGDAVVVGEDEVGDDALDEETDTENKTPEAPSTSSTPSVADFIHRPLLRGMSTMSLLAGDEEYLFDRFPVEIPQGQEEAIQGVVYMFNLDAKKGLALAATNKVFNPLSTTHLSRFLYLYRHTSLSPNKVGEFFGSAKPFNQSVLDAYTARMKLDGMGYLDALRYYLSCFTLPCESQQIDRVVSCFAGVYYNVAPELFSSMETVYVFAFSTIMLNTDLHNPQNPKRMTKGEFVKNNRGIDGGKDIPSDFLHSVFHSIKQTEIAFPEGGDPSVYTFVSPEHSGYMVKQGGRIKTWKKRWFILSESCLYYFKKKTDKKPVGIIPLEDLGVREVDRTVTFEIYHKESTGIKSAKVTAGGMMNSGNHSTYVLRCKDHQEREEWMNQISSKSQHLPIRDLINRRRRAAASGRSADTGTVRRR